MVLISFICLEFLKGLLMRKNGKFAPYSVQQFRMEHIVDVKMRQMGNCASWRATIRDYPAV
jgi:hypothetical protein